MQDWYAIAIDIDCDCECEKNKNDIFIYNWDCIVSNDGILSQIAEMKCYLSRLEDF